MHMASDCAPNLVPLPPTGASWALSKDFLIPLHLQMADRGALWCSVGLTGVNGRGFPTCAKVLLGSRAVAGSLPLTT